MVLIKSQRGKRTYEYPDKITEGGFLINKKIREDFNKICKEKRIHKGLLIEKFYKAIILRFKDNTLNASNGYITIDVLGKDVQKSPKLV